MKRRRLLVVAMAIAVFVGFGARALAKTEQKAEARRLFDKAAEALNTGRFAEARDLLRRSLALASNAGSAFNLAVALRGTGEPLEALEVFDRLLGGAFGALDEAKRKQVTQLRAATNAEVAVLHIAMRGAPSAEIRVDGRSIGTVKERERLSWRVDPGERLVAALAQGRKVAERHLEISRGASTWVDLMLVPTEDARFGTIIVESVHPSDVLEIVGVARGTGALEKRLLPGSYAVSVSGPSGARFMTAKVKAGEVLRLRLDQESKPWWKSWWLWSSVGLAAAGIVTTVVLLSVERTRDPVSDPTWDIVQTLRSR